MTFFVPSLKERNLLDRLFMTICVVGSRKLGQENYAAMWQWFAPNLAIYGVEADAESCAEMNHDLEQQQESWTERHIPAVLWHTPTPLTLYLTQDRACSSVYRPNQALIQRLTGYRDKLTVTARLPLNATTLSDLCQQESIPAIDFLQIDVQGAELPVMQGAGSRLDDLLGIVSEVEFIDTYENQPLFSDVDQFLRKQGLTLFDLYIGAGRSRYQDAPVMSEWHPGTLVWADAFYLRDLLRGDQLATIDPDRLLKLACIADTLHFYDYALEVLEYITCHYGDDDRYNLADAIVEALAQSPALLDRGLDSIPVVQRLKDYLVDYSI